MSGQGGDSASPNIGPGNQTKVSPPSGKFKVHIFKSKNRSPDLQRDTTKEGLTVKDDNSGGALSKILRVLKRADGSKNDSQSGQPPKKLIRFKRKSPSPPHSGTSAFLMMPSSEKDGEQSQ